MGHFCRLFLLIVVVGSPAVASAQRPWEKVTSKSGQFTVEMPTQPDINLTRTRRGTGGTTKIYLTGCKTDTGMYFVYRMDLPVAIVRGAEDRELDSVRDYLAEEWNGRVLTEKSVRAGLRIGRDFTVRGTPIEETGVLTIRIRMYLDGKTIYAMLVGSAPNRELPADAGRFLGSLSIGDERIPVASGRPEPEPTGKDLPGWGLAIDPDKDCRFTPNGKQSLSIAVPGSWHDLNPHVNKLNSPRVLRTVEGDFEVVVKVLGVFRPGGQPQDPRSVPSVGAGIVVWNNSDNFIRLERFAISRNNKVHPFVAFVEREGGHEGAQHNHGYEGGDCYLKMVRQGSRITGLISMDKRRWLALKPIDTLWPARLKVGLAVSNTTSQQFSARFEEYSVTGKVVTGGAPKSRR